MKTVPLVSLSLLGFAVAAQAQLIISDDYNTADTADIDTELATRERGSAAVKDYLTGGGGTVTISGNKLRLGATTGNDTTAGFNYDFATDPNLLAGGAFSVSFLLDNQSQSYAAFTMGSTAGDVGYRPVIDSNSDFTMLMSHDTGSVRTAGSGLISGIPFAGWAAATEGLFVFTVTTDDFDLGTSYSVGLTLNGTTVDLAPGDGGSDIFTGTWDADETNYMYLSGRGTFGYSTIDDLSISSVPEPSQYALVLGVMALFGLLIRRCRR